MKGSCNATPYKGNVKTVCGGLDQGAKNVFFLEQEGNQVYDSTGQKDFGVQLGAQAGSPRIQLLCEQVHGLW